MATQSFDNIKILVQASAVYGACDKIFYGADSTVPDADPDGYPNENLDNLGFNVSDYEIITPIALGANLSVSNNDGTVTASSAVFTTNPVGKLLWDGTDVNNLKLIGKIASKTSDTVVELVNPYLGTNLTTVAGYISNVADNNQSLDHKRGFIVLVKTVEDPAGRIIPAIKDLKASSTTIIEGVAQGLNTTYVSLNRISTKGSKSSPVSAQAVPATITRINRYPVSTQPNLYFNSNNDVPIWVAYLVNPFGDNNKNLDKNTTYVLEFDEVLPTWDDGGNPKVIGAYVSYVSEKYGFI